MWKQLTTADERKRFVEIMQKMDSGYAHLSVKDLDQWLALRDRPLELFGLVGDDGVVGQVMSIRSDPPLGFPRRDVVIDMLGVDGNPNASEADVLRWFGHFVLEVKRLVGTYRFRAERPNKMSFAPMQALHDCVPNGEVVKDEQGAEFKVNIDTERPRKDSVLWQLRIVGA